MIVQRSNGELVGGVVAGCDYNPCTFELQYDIDYMKEGKHWTMICVPEDAITAL